MSLDGYTYLIKIDTNGNVVLPSLAQNADRVDTSIRRIDNDSEKSFATLSRSASKSNGILSNTKSLLAGLGLTLTTGALATGLVSVGAGFEKSMSNVRALADATQKEYVDLKKAARDAGATTVFSATQSADAMGFLAAAGFKTNQIIEALPATLNLAASGGMDLARSADIASNILSQFRMQANQTDIVVDQLALTSSRFNTNIEEAADAMNYFGPTAAAMKISLAETNATIGLLSNNGLKGSLATRALGTSIVRLANPTKQMLGVMNRLKIGFYDQNGQFIGIAGMIDTLNNRFQGLTDKQKMAALSTLFGGEAIQELNILMAEGADKIRYWTSELEKADGTAKKMAETKLDNLAGDFQMLSSNVEEFTLSLYDELQPSLRLVTKEAALFVQSLSTKEAGVMLKNTVLNIRNGLVWLYQHRDGIVSLIKGYAVFKVTLYAYNIGTKAAALATTAYNTVLTLTSRTADGASVGIQRLNMAIKANPFGLLLGAVTAVVSAITLFTSRTNEAIEAQNELNLKRVEAEMLAQENDDLRKNTGIDLLKIKEAEKLEQRQLINLKEAAKLRKEKAEDFILDLQAKSGVDAQKYLKLHEEFQGGKNKKSSSEMTQEELLRFLKYNTLETTLKEIMPTNGKMNFTEAITLIGQNKQIIDKVSGLIKEDTNKPIRKPGTAISGAAETSENIVSGGTSQRIVNVHVAKFQDKIEFNIHGQIEELRNNMETMRTMINEQFMRILNSSNQLVNG